MSNFLLVSIGGPFNLWLSGPVARALIEGKVIVPLREAKPSDLKQLADFVNSAYRGETSKAGWTTEADILDGQRTDPASLREMLEHEQVILLADGPEYDGQLVGCVYLKRSGTSAYLGMLTVHPQLQAQGLGRRILTAAEAYAQKQWSAQSVQMTVISVRKELIAWYERRGYQRTQQTEKFPYGDERFGLPKRSDLEFLVLKKNLK